MPATLTPDSSPAFPASLTAPLNGENLDATQEAVLDKALLNGVAAARLMLYGGKVKRTVVAASATSMTIGPLVAVMAGTTAAGPVDTVVVMNAPVTINPRALVGGNFVANTRYWVYAQLSGSPATISAWVVSTTAPEATLSYKSDDLSCYFVTTFFAISTSGYLRYAQDDRYYAFWDRTSLGAGASGNLALDTDSTTPGPTTVAWGNSVPTQANCAKIEARFTGGAGPEVGKIHGTGIGVGPQVALTATLQATVHYDCPSSNGQTFDFALSAGTGSCAAWIAGFWL
ncbi:MAG TPA: hypothetical protein PLW65_04525 [Pseudomonadota bacterium]|nr:hypothetical protein [Pseudomonadota bacterium]